MLQLSLVKNMYEQCRDSKAKTLLATVEAKQLVIAPVSINAGYRDEGDQD